MRNRSAGCSFSELPRIKLIRLKLSPAKPQGCFYNTSHSISVRFLTDGFVWGLFVYDTWFFGVFFFLSPLSPPFVEAQQSFQLTSLGTEIFAYYIILED